MKVNSEPDRSNSELLDLCRAYEIIVYLGVPNTTAVLQEMDKSYGGFKTGFYVSISSIVEHRLKTSNGVGQPQMGVEDYRMLVFSGKEGTFDLPNLFEQYLSIKYLKLF